MARPQNAFIRSLSPGIFDLLSEQLKPVEMSVGTYIQHDEVDIDWVYFPETCLMSMISSGEQGESVETSMVGAEGAAGLLEACGSGKSAVDCVVQVDGKAWRVPSSWCRNLASSEPGFASHALRIAELQLAEARQSGLCQAMHSVEQRMARWLLESMDRTGGRNPLPMTQEFLAAMLGVHRTTVASYASKLQALELIASSRGALKIIARGRLEAFSCGCHRAMQHRREILGLSQPMAAGLSSKR